jgi:hypothetical protein
MGKDVELAAEANRMIGSQEMTLDMASLMDVTDVASKAGFVYPVIVSRHLFERCLTIRSEDPTITDEDRLWMFFFSLPRNHEPVPEVCRKQWSCTFTTMEDWYFGQIKVVRTANALGEEIIILMLPMD